MQVIIESNNTKEAQIISKRKKIQVKTWKFWAFDHIRNEHIELTNLFFHNCVSVFGLGRVKGVISRTEWNSYSLQFFCNIPRNDIWHTPNILNGAKRILSVFFQCYWTKLKSYVQVKSYTWIFTVALFIVVQLGRD